MSETDANGRHGYLKNSFISVRIRGLAYACMVEMEDTRALGTRAIGVRVQIPLQVLVKGLINQRLKRNRSDYPMKAYKKRSVFL